MHILYIHQYFSTPRGVTGTRSYEFAKRWIKAGHNVVMLTTTTQLCEQDLQDAKGRFIKQAIIDGIDVRAVNLPYNQKMGFIKRSLSFIGFVLVASVYVLFVKRPAVIYATSTPLTVGIPALIAKWLRRIPFVFEVRDQWPEIPIELGIIRNPLLKGFLLWLEKRIYLSSSAVVALSPGMADGVRKIIGDRRPITVVSNCCDTELFGPEVDGLQLRKEHGWEHKFVLMHFGAMGKANGLDFVVKVADRLRNESQIKFILVGSGSERAKITKQTQNLHLSNIEIIPPQPKTVLPEYVAACNVSMVIFADHPILEHNSANKLFDSLSAGKPVLLNYGGWHREVIEEAKAGLGCKQCDLNEFVENVLRLFGCRESLDAMGNNARKLAETRFSRDLLAQKVLEAIENVKLLK